MYRNLSKTPLATVSKAAVPPQPMSPAKGPETVYRPRLAPKPDGKRRPPAFGVSASTFNAKALKRALYNDLKDVPFKLEILEAKQVFTDINHLHTTLEVLFSIHNLDAVTQTVERALVLLPTAFKEGNLELPTFPNAWTFINCVMWPAMGFPMVTANIPEFTKLIEAALACDQYSSFYSFNQEHESILTSINASPRIVNKAQAYGLCLEVFKKYLVEMPKERSMLMVEKCVANLCSSGAFSFDTMNQKHMKATFKMLVELAKAEDAKSRGYGENFDRLVGFVTSGFKQAAVDGMQEANILSGMLQELQLANAILDEILIADIEAIGKFEFANDFTQIILWKQSMTLMATRFRNADLLHTDTYITRIVNAFIELLSDPKLALNFLRNEGVVEIVPKSRVSWPTWLNAVKAAYEQMNADQKYALPPRVKEVFELEDLPPPSKTWAIPRTPAAVEFQFPKPVASPAPEVLVCKMVKKFGSCKFCDAGTCRNMRRK
jgi:hypothetical protein